jgi:cytosine/adenosine deaminase-related metal-dependent hydrolase
VFPGLINAHTHLMKVVARGILEDVGFPSTLAFPVDVRDLMSAEEKHLMVILGALESIRSGTTCLLEIGREVQSNAEGMERTGLRWVLSEYVEDLDIAKAREGVYEYSEEKRESGLRKSADLIEAWHGHSGGRISCFLAPGAPESCSSEMLRRCRKMAEDYDTGYTIHLCQSQVEMEAVMRLYGVRPTHFLFSNEFLGPRLVAAHCRHLDSSEVAMLGKAGCGISNNPAIAARRGAAAPVMELQAAGCTIGMGSDNMSQDMVEVLRSGLFYERVRRTSQEVPQPEDVLEWATRGSARALGLGEQVGSLEVGKKADLFIVDALRAHLVPNLRIVSAFVHNGKPGDISDVMVDGRWLMRDGRVLTIDEEDIVRRAEEVGHAAWRRLLEKYPNVPFPVTLPPRS